MATNDRWVVPSSTGGWGVARQEQGRVTESFSTKAEAVDRAREILRKGGGGQLIAKTRDGRFRVLGTVKAGAPTRLSRKSPAARAHLGKRPTKRGPRKAVPTKGVPSQHTSARVRVRITLNHGAYDTREAASVLASVDRLYLAVSRCYGLGYARPTVEIHSGSLIVDLIESRETVGAALTALFLALSGKRLPQVLTLPDRVRAKRTEILLERDKHELERERIAREVKQLRASTDGLVIEMQDPN